MGTSALDLIIGKPGSNNTSQQLSPSKKISALDIIKNPNVPDHNAIAQFSGTNDDNGTEPDNSFGHTLSSFISYIGSLGNKNTFTPGDSSALNSAPGTVVKEIGHNISSDLGNAINYYKTTPFSQIANDAVQMTSEGLSNTSPGNIASGLLKGFIEKPIEALTLTVNDNGTAKPASIQQQSESMQSTAGLVAQIGAFKALKSSFIGAMPEDVTGATNALKSTQIGPLALSGSMKAGAKYIGSESLAGGLSGGIGGAISGIGQDNQHEQIFGAALSFLPLSAAMSVFGVKGYVNSLVKNRDILQAAETGKATTEIAAINALRINPSDPISTLIKNIDATTSADKLTIAAIKSKLSNKDGYIVEGVSPEVGKQLMENINPSTSTYPDNYVPPTALNKPRPRPNSVEVKFDSPFDKLAYLAANKKPSPYVKALIDDAVQQTGLTRDEIVSHGQSVRLAQKQAFQSAKLIPRTQAEIDAYNQAAIEEGKAKIAASADGTKIKDSNDDVWTRNGNSFVNKDGTASLPADQANTWGILGRKKNDTPFYQPFQQLEKQPFNPNFSRVESDTPVNFHYAKNGTLLVTPVNYTPEALAFFKQTGFMKGEIVNASGVDHVINGYTSGDFIGATDLTNGVKKEFQYNWLKRTNNSLTPDIKPGVGTKAPLLTPESYIDNLYNKFYKAYQNAPKDESFSSTAQKFYSQNGIAEKDYNHLSTVFTSKLSEDLAKFTLSIEEQAARNRLLKSFSDLKDEQIQDHSNWLSRQAEGNNLFYSPEGNGRYRLRFQDTGNTYAVVGSPAEALTAINKMRQASGLDLDGGYTGSIPPGIGNLGGLTDGYNPKYTNIERYIDQSRFAGFLQKFSPVYHMLQSGDNLAKSVGKDTQFGPLFLKLQKVLMDRKNIISRDSGLQKLADKMQSSLDLGASIPSERRMLVADNLDAMSIDDIKNRYLSRKMSSLEDATAQELSKVDTGKLQQLLSDTKAASPNSNVGSQAYLTTLNKVATIQKVDPEIIKKAHLFSGLINSSSPEIFSGDAVLRLAAAYEHPDLAISQVQHANQYKLTSKELKYGSMVRDNFKDAAIVAGIDPKLVYNMYLPSLVRQIASGKSSGIPEGFAREMNRVGITPKNIMIRDPNLLLSKYFTSLVNHKTDFNTHLQSFSDGINTEADKLTGSKYENVIPSFKAQMSDYVQQAQGHKTPGDAMWSSIRDISGKLGMKSPSVNSVMQAMSLGSIALRPALAVRDFHNIAGLAYGSFGHEFTQHFLTDAVNPKYVKWMKDNNLLPDSQMKSIIDPQVDESDLIAHKFPLMNKMSNATFAISGQEAAYEHANAGIYQGSMKMASKYFEQLRNKSISKTEAYDKLGISSNYGPGMIGQIDKYLQDGRPDKAADLYAQANMRMLSHVYGFHNNPIGWNTTWGRLLSQWGSWSANASQTAIDQFSRGSKSQVAAKALRLGIFNAATVGIGSSLGFNLKSWTVSNPMTVWPTTGPLAGLSSDLSDDYGQGRTVSSSLEGLMSGFIPYGRAAQGWVKGLDLVGQGRLIQGLGKMGGMPISK